MMTFISMTLDPFITYFEYIISEHFIISSIKPKDKYFILYDNSIVFVKQIKKHAYGEVMLVVTKFNEFFPISNNPICSFIVGCFYVITNTISVQFDIKLESLKSKCFFIPTSNSKALVISL